MEDEIARFPNILAISHKITNNETASIQEVLVIILPLTLFILVQNERQYIIQSDIGHEVPQKFGNLPLSKRLAQNGRQNLSFEGKPQIWRGKSLHVLDLRMHSSHPYKKTLK